MSQVLGRKENAGIGGPLLNPSNVPEPPSDYPAEVPPHTYAIWIAQDCYLYTRFGRPNWFRRFWLWVFFGWRWTPVEKGQGTDG